MLIIATNTGFAVARDRVVSLLPIRGFLSLGCQAEEYATVVLPTPHLDFGTGTVTLTA